MLILAGLLAAGCATSYHPAGFSGGYLDQRLSPDTFAVGFVGNGYVPFEKARDYALLRASQLTIEAGFTHFTIIDEASNVNPGGTGAFSKSSAEFKIQCFAGKQESAGSYDAAFLQQSLRRKYNIQ